MGTFKQRVEIAANADQPFRALDAMVDTGSTYTWVPGTMLRDLGLTRTEQIEFTVANGKPEFRDAVEALIRLDGRLRHAICVFGDEKDLVRLGAYTLEGFALAADPVNKRLVRMPTIPAAGAGIKAPHRPGIPQG